MKSYKVDIYGLSMYTNADNKTEARKFFKQSAKKEDTKLPKNFPIVEVEIEEKK